MQRSSVFILSSLWEEMGFVIIEAAMNDLYVISSDCPNGPREFLNYGRNGILFSNNLNDSLCNGLKKFAETKKEKIFNDKVLENHNQHIHDPSINLVNWDIIPTDPNNQMDFPI